MQGKIYEIPLDISSGVLTQQIRQVVTEDMGTNTFRFKLVKDKHIPYNLTGTIVRMIAKTPSGARVQQECTIENAVAGTISLILKQSLILEPGSYIAEIQIYDEITQSIRLTTPTFDYHVRESLQNSESIVATDEYTILQQALADLAGINIVVANKADKSDVGDPEDLTTTEKANLVAAINEVKSQSNETATQTTTHTSKTVDDVGGVHGLNTDKKTWIPFLKGDTIAGTHTYSVQTGSYYKIGKLIIATAFCVITSKDVAMAGNICIGGLPYANGDGNIAVNVAGYRGCGLSTGFTQLGAALAPNKNYLVLQEMGSNQPRAYVQPSAIANNFLIELTVSYYIG